MNCSDLDFLLQRTAAPKASLPQDAEEHLHTCNRCRLLAAALDREPGGGPVPEKSIAAIETQMLKDLRPVHVLPPKKYFFAAFMLVFIVLIAAGVVHLGTAAWSELSVARRILIFTSLGASAALLAYAMVQQMYPGSRRHLHSAFLPAGTFVFLTLVLAALFESGHSGHFFTRGMPCFEAGIPYAVPAAILFWLMLRRGVILSPLATGAICGALAGLIGVSVLEIHCSNFDLLHILVWHVGVGVAGAVAGLIAGCIGAAIGRRHSRTTLA